MCNIYRNKFLCILFFGILICIIPIASHAANELDGKSYSVTVNEKGKTDGATQDILIFDNGTFFSTDCEQYGFKAAPYNSESKGNQIKFNSTIQSSNEGKNEWQGIVEGDNISGSFIWTKEAQKPIEYKFEGKLKK